MGDGLIWAARSSHEKDKKGGAEKHEKGQYRRGRRDGAVRDTAAIGEHRKGKGEK